MLFWNLAILAYLYLLYFWIFIFIPLSEYFCVFLRRAYDLSSKASNPIGYYFGILPDSFKKLDVKDIVLDGLESFNAPSLDGMLLFWNVTSKN